MSYIDEDFELIPHTQLEERKVYSSTECLPYGYKDMPGWSHEGNRRDMFSFRICMPDGRKLKAVNTWFSDWKVIDEQA